MVEVPAEMEYSLTQDGKTLYPILVETSRRGTRRQ
ncbi:winged helix-turn-helix transcriptional regulator [Roseibium sp. HPY-6]